MERERLGRKHADRCCRLLGKVARHRRKGRLRGCDVGCLSLHDLDLISNDLFYVENSAAVACSQIDEAITMKGRKTLDIGHGNLRSFVSLN